MIRLNPSKLLHTQWTATQPREGEKHFIVMHVAGKKAHAGRQVTMQAVLTGHTFAIDWRDLSDEQRWRQGWNGNGK